MFNYIKGFFTKQSKFYKSMNSKQTLKLVVGFTLYLFIFAYIIMAMYDSPLLIITNVIIFTIGFGLVEEVMTKKIVGRSPFSFFEYLPMYTIVGIILSVIVFFVR